MQCLTIGHLSRPPAVPHTAAKHADKQESGHQCAKDKPGQEVIKNCINIFIKTHTLYAAFLWLAVLEHFHLGHPTSHSSQTLEWSWKNKFCSTLLTDWPLTDHCTGGQACHRT